MSLGDGITLITGGAGFIGTNVAARVLDGGGRVRILDNLARRGVGDNIRWLVDTYGGARIDVDEAGVLDESAVRRAVRDVDRVFHFAAQVAVTTSVDDPVGDFDVNLRGTLVLLEALRRQERRIPLLFTSTNKVYGGLDDLTLTVHGDRYRPTDAHLGLAGISEARPLSFCSPYGCSKGGADQYVLDYAHSYGLPNVVFRMSCIYGPHQHGNADQGWVAHFMLCALAGAPITIYGDGRQVRDVLFVDDLVDAMTLAVDRVPAVAGQAFNLGGGSRNSASLREVLRMIGRLVERDVDVSFGGWRVGDQRWFVTDTSRFTDATGWQPRVGIEEGLARLHQWCSGQRVGVGRADGR